MIRCYKSRFQRGITRWATAREGADAEILDKLERIRQLLKKQERVRLGTLEHEALMQQIRARSAEYQALISVWNWETVSHSSSLPPRRGQPAGNSTSMISSTCSGRGRRYRHPYCFPALRPGFCGSVLGSCREKGAACRFPVRSASSNNRRSRSFSLSSASIFRSSSASFSVVLSFATTTK